MIVAAADEANGRAQMARRCNRSTKVKHMIPDDNSSTDLALRRILQDCRAIAMVGAIRVIWTQLGICDVQSAARTRDTGIAVVMDRCLKIEHTRLILGKS
jgi:predicted CoA-binding protein